MAVSPADILSALESAASGGESIPGPLALWLVRYASDTKKHAEQMAEAIELAVQPEQTVEDFMGFIAQSGHKLSTARKGYADSVDYYNNPEEHEPRVYNFPKSQGDLWLSVATKLAAAVMTMVERDQDQAMTDPLLIAALAALNGYNSLAHEPLVGYDAPERPDDEVYEGPCRFCADIGKIPCEQCPACKRDALTPSTRMGIDIDLRPLAVHIVPLEQRGLVTPHELDAFVAGYFVGLENLRANQLPGLFLKVWEDWAAEVSKPHRAGAKLDTPALTDGPVGPEAVAELPSGAFPPPVLFRALRNEPEDAFLVARMRAGSAIARLEDVETILCVIKTTPGDDHVMRRDYRAAEAFAALLTALPALVTMVEGMDSVLDPTQWMPESPGIEGAVEVPVGD